MTFLRQVIETPSALEDTIFRSPDPDFHSGVCEKNAHRKIYCLFKVLPPHAPQFNVASIADIVSARLGVYFSGLGTPGSCTQL